MMNQDLKTMIYICYVEIEILSDYDIALKHLNEQYGLLMVEYKLYHTHLLRNDNFIKHYQKIHCDFDFVKSKNTITKKTIKYTKKNE